MAERQAADVRRAQDKAKHRKEAESVANYPQAAIVRAEYLTNWSGTYDSIWTPEQTEQWRRDNDKAWNQQQQQEEWKRFTETMGERTDEQEGEADRSERRSRGSREDIRKENLISQERIRIASTRRYEEKQRREGRSERNRMGRR